MRIVELTQLVRDGAKQNLMDQKQQQQQKKEFKLKNMLRNIKKKEQNNINEIEQWFDRDKT